MEDPIKKCDRMLRYWQRRRDELTVNATVNVNAVDAKEEGKGKETFPPSPPIEKKEREKKGAGVGEGARARKVAEVAAYNDQIGGNINAEYFVDYYADHWPRNWQARLRNWLLEDKSSGRLMPTLDASNETQPPRPIDWTLCRERCANCGADGCKCGISVPPAWNECPYPPEECAKFKVKG